MVLWRDKARQVFDVWLQDHGAPSALEYTKKVPPKALSGRWGAISACEDHILKCPLSQLRNVLKKVLTGSQQKKEKCNTTPQLDEVRQSDAATYSENMSKWTTDVLSMLHCEQFYHEILLPMWFCDKHMCVLCESWLAASQRWLAVVIALVSSFADQSSACIICCC